MPLQVEEALSSLSFLQRGPIDLSPDGQWVAYTLEDPRRKVLIKDDKYTFLTHTGASIFVVGCDVWVTNISSGVSKSLTDGKGSNWDPVWSPNGDYLAFYSDRNGQAGLWVWEKASDTLRQVSDVIVRPAYVDEAVQWTPDSQKILCPVLPEGMLLEDFFDLFMEPVKQGNEEKKEDQSSAIIYRSPAVLTQNNNSTPSWDNAEEANISNFRLCDLALVDVSNASVERVAHRMKVLGCRLSPDGTDIAVTIWKESCNEIRVISLSDAALRAVATNIHPVPRRSTVSWSPDGKLLSYTSKGDCYVLPINGEGPRNLTEGQSPDFTHDYRPPLWDATGQNLYFLHSDMLWKVSVSNGSITPIVQFPNKQLVEVISPTRGEYFWSPDSGRSLYVITRDNETKRVGFCKVDLITERSTQLIEEDIDCGRYTAFTIDISDDGQRVIYTKEDAQHCPDIWIASVDFHNPRRLTHINQSLDAVVMGTSQIIEWRSLDGEKLRGSLLLPADYETGNAYPLVVWVYSGYFSNNVNRFGMRGSGAANLQILATRGYAVLLPDMPLQVGSPMRDVAKMVIPGVDKVVEMGIADPDRLGVMGHSYGGYCVLSLIVQTPRFKAAVGGGGTGNLISAYGTMRHDGSTYLLPWAETGQGRMGGTPWEMRDRYIENSPMFYLDRVQTPLLLFHGALDSATPAFMSEEIFVGLRRLKKSVMYVKYEGETHTPIDWAYANQLDYWNRIVSWFNEHLKPK